MTSPAELDTSEQYMATARRWFTEGWKGDLAMADHIFSEDLRTNGVHVGVAGPVGRIRDRLGGLSRCGGNRFLPRAPRPVRKNDLMSNTITKNMPRGEETRRPGEGFPG
jgi:hypothetical protein